MFARVYGLPTCVLRFFMVKASPPAPPSSAPCLVTQERGWWQMGCSRWAVAPAWMGRSDGLGRAGQVYGPRQPVSGAYATVNGVFLKQVGAPPPAAHSPSRL